MSDKIEFQKYIHQDALDMIEKLSNNILSTVDEDMLCDELARNIMDRVSKAHVERRNKITKTTMFVPEGMKIIGDMNNEQ